MAIQLEHPDPAQQQASLALQMREFWMEGHLCDVAVKSREGKEHKAHRVVLSAASTALKALLGGEFSEGKEKGWPVEFCTSDASVVALLDFIYGGKPQVPVEDSIELLGLADAYDLPHLAQSIGAGLRASLENAPVTTALRILQESHGLHDLKDACEDHLALNFEACTQDPDFVKLKPAQLSRLLQRGDLNVQWEEVVLQGIFRWLNHSKDRDQFLGLLVQHVDFPFISFENLSRIRRFAASIGQNGDELQREVNRALQAQNKRSTDEATQQTQPKRRCLQHMSSERVRKVLSKACTSLCWHENAVYATCLNARNGPCSVMCWKPGTEAQVVAGQGARIAGINDFGPMCGAFGSLTGELLVAERKDSKLRVLSFRNGFGQVVHDDLNGKFKYLSPNGVIYVRHGKKIQKLVGSGLQPVTADLSFTVGGVFVTNEEVVYFANRDHGRILRIGPGEAEPTTVGEVTGGPSSDIGILFVTEEGRIYAVDTKQRKVWAFDPGSTACFEVLECPDGMTPTGVVAQARSLFVSTGDIDGQKAVDSVYEYALPPVLQLD